MTAPAPHEVLPYQIAENTLFDHVGIGRPTDRSFRDAFDAYPRAGAGPR